MHPSSRPKPRISAQERLESLISKLNNQDAGEQFKAVGDLGELGPLAKPAVADLVKALNASDDLALKHEILITLGRIGTEAADAVPAVAEHLKQESPVLQHAAIQTLRHIGPKAKAAVPQLTELAKSNDPVIGVASAWALVSIVDDLKTRMQFLPVLVGGLEKKDPGVVSDAVAALAEVGKPAIPQLIPRLNRDNAEVAILAADTLAMMGPDAEPATNALVAALDNKNEEVAWRAARNLGIIAAQSETVVPALAKHLSATSPMVRTACAMALGNYGNAASAAVADLAKALSDESVEVRVAAARALGAIGPDAKSAVPALDKALDDPAGIVTLSAAEALGSIKGPAVQVLADRLKEPAFLPLAAAVLGNIGADAAPATAELVKHLNSQEPESQLEVLIAIAAIGPQAADAATKPLMELLKTGEGRQKRGAVYALAKIGCKEAVPLFQRGVMQTDDELLQRTCAWALVTLEPENSEYAAQALPRLMTGLSDEMPLVRKECAIAIQKLGPQAKAAVPALLKALETSDPQVQAEILDALAQIGPDAKAAIPAAIKLLGSPNPMVQYTALHLLGALGKAAQDAVPAIEKIYNGRDEFGKAVAAWALVSIDPKPENVTRAIPMMIKALGHENPSVRVHAAQMLGKIGKGNSDVKAALEKAKNDEDESVKKAVDSASHCAELVVGPTSIGVCHWLRQCKWRGKIIQALAKPVAHNLPIQDG